jgi:hypothetical protein
VSPRYRSVDELGPEHVGRRVTVRRRLPDGMLGDVIGVLEKLDDKELVILDRRGHRNTISIGDMVAARVIS